MTHLSSDSDNFIVFETQDRASNRGQKGRILVYSLVAVAVFVALCSFLPQSSSGLDGNDDRLTRSSPITSAMDYRNRSRLAKITLDRLLNQTQVISANHSTRVEFVPPCDYDAATREQVMESTSSLLVATALTKAGNSTLQTHNMWHYFNGLFEVPASTGFIPKYLYPVRNNGHAASHALYVADTRIPDWNMFYNLSTDDIPLPCNIDAKNKTFCWIGSGRIAATPFHATFLLELVLRLEKQDSISDGGLNALYRYWKQIYAFHEYLHENVMQGCGDSNQTSDDVPCYNIVHPWESTINMKSPFWEETLKPTITTMKESNWTLPFDVPKQIENSYDYDPDIYAANIFLAECLTNQTYNASSGDAYPYHFHGDAAAYELQILQQCPFAMLDVGFASALAQADEDLHNVALWLRQRNVKNPNAFHSEGWSARLAKFTQWREQSRHVMHLLWNKQQGSYLSKYSKPSLQDDALPDMVHAKTPVASNLMVFWQRWPNDDDFEMRWDDGAPDHLRQVLEQMLRHDGDFSFDCPNFPIWSGGCSDPSSVVDPMINYFVGLGLFRNSESVITFGEFLTNATIDLILQNRSSQADLSFPEVYPASNVTSFVLDQCGASSSATAAIFYNLLLNDFDFSFELPIPPIRNSWILTLISAELFIAFAVGVSCICLSLSLVRKENNAQQNDSDGSYMPVEGGEFSDDGSMPSLDQRVE